ncbi:MAG: hypothetical protein ACYCZ1_08625 [Candidatus Humimicrobiaceae bacterium]
MSLKINNTLKDLSCYHELTHRVDFIGFEQVITLKEKKRWNSKRSMGSDTVK